MYGICDLIDGIKERFYERGGFWDRFWKINEILVDIG